MCVCAQKLSHVQLFETTWTVACQEYKFYCPMGRLPFPAPWDLLDLEIKPISLVSPYGKVDFL